MLVLSRKRGQSIIINQNIEIFITAIEGEQVKIGISAPKEYSILRKEVVEGVRDFNQNALLTLEEMKQLNNWVQSHESEQKK